MTQGAVARFLLLVVLAMVLAGCSTSPAVPARAVPQIYPRVKGNPCAHMTCRPPVETRHIA